MIQVPLQIVFEHIGHSDALEAAVRKEAQRLERFHDRITSTRVVIARLQHRHHKGDMRSHSRGRTRQKAHRCYPRAGSDRAA